MHATLDAPVPPSFVLEVTPSHSLVTREGMVTPCNISRRHAALSGNTDFLQQRADQRPHFLSALADKAIGITNNLLHFGLQRVSENPLARLRETLLHYRHMRVNEIE